MGRTGRKTRRRRTSGSADLRRSSGRKGGTPPTLASRIRAARTWIITTAVAGLGLSITGAVVGLTHIAAGRVGGAIGMVHNTEPKNANINTAAGPVLGLQISQGFGSPCGSGGDGWVFPKSASAAVATSPAKGPTRNGQTWVSNPSVWGAVVASDVTLQMAVTGRTQQPILLTGIKVNVLQRLPAIQGTVVNIQQSSHPCPTASPAPFQGDVVNLDTSPPTVSAVVPSEDTYSVTPAKFPYVVSATDLEPFILLVTTKHCDCTWTLELDWISGSSKGASIITDNGKPFETTASAGLPSIEWSYGPQNGSWQKVS